VSRHRVRLLAAVLLALISLSGGGPLQVEVVYAPAEGPLVLGCPSGSCDGRSRSIRTFQKFQGPALDATAAAPPC
jgi:hypothetical protein